MLALLALKGATRCWRQGRHSDAQIAAIAGSIAAFGFNLASLKLGLDTVPVVVLDHLSEIEKRAYILAD